jgi:thymidylate synthase ThyX
MFQPSAKIIADSINESGDRLTTFVLTFHRFILSEFATHRMFSKNASSSRAIPVEKMIKIVEDAHIEPIHWGANCKGMSAKEELDERERYLARLAWNTARDNAIQSAKLMVELGVHKQVVNRLLEPFAPITVICTATEYQNFFAQRCHPDAQPEIKALAEAMKAEYEVSVPEKINTGDWHIPFVKEIPTVGNLIKISVGRCARVSYLNHEGKDDPIADGKLHDRLLASEPPHLSPFEHCAMAMPSGKFANFTGWQSYRNQLEISRNLI